MLYLYVPSTLTTGDFRRDNMGVWLKGHKSPKMPYQNCTKTVSSNANTFVWRYNFTRKSYPKLKKTEIYRAERKTDDNDYFL